MSDETRPPQPTWDLPAGYEWVAEPDSEWETVADDEAKRCRFGRPSCKAPSVARLNRGRNDYVNGDWRDSWWHYCADHLYGRWVEDGRVMAWHLRKAVPR